jgi:hypothetical protein
LGILSLAPLDYRITGRRHDHAERIVSAVFMVDVRAHVTGDVPEMRSVWIDWYFTLDEQNVVDSGR